MTGKQTLFQMVIYGMIALAAVIGAVILGYNGSLNSDAVAAILVGALALAGGSAASTGAVYAAVNGKSTVTPQLLAEQGATNRTAIVAASSSQPTQVTPVEVTATPDPQ
jgi:hypothetical protein